VHGPCDVGGLAGFRAAHQLWLSRDDEEGVPSRLSGQTGYDRRALPDGIPKGFDFDYATVE
jgi:hypothetical protein